MSTFSIHISCMSVGASKTNQCLYLLYFEAVNCNYNNFQITSYCFFQVNSVAVINIIYIILYSIFTLHSICILLIWSSPRNWPLVAGTCERQLTLAQFISREEVES